MYKQFISYNARGCKKYSPGTIVPFGEYCVQPLLSDGHELCEWTEDDSGNRGRYLKGVKGQKLGGFLEKIY